MRLIEHDRVPPGPVRMYCSLYGGVHRRQIQAHDPEIVVGLQRVLSHCLSGDRAQAAAEEPLEVSLPFRNQVSRGDNKGAAQKAQPLHLAQVHPSHDGLAGSRLVCEQESEVRLREHGAVNGVHLMRVRLEGRRGKRSGSRPSTGGPHPSGPQAGQDSGGVAATILGQRFAGCRLLLSQIDLLEMTRGLLDE